MTTHIEIDLDCPACGTAFKTRTWTSTNVMARKTDFHPMAAGFSPLPLYVHTCSHCGYSGYEGDFQPETVVSQELADRIRKEIGPRVGEGLADASMRFEFAGLIAEWRGDDPDAIADSYVYAAWSCAEVGHREREEKYRRLAIGYLKRALDVPGLVPPDRVPLVTYLIGELHRRVGEVDIALSWFDRVISEGGEGENAEMAMALAKQQRDDPQDMMDDE